jgi:hypothetical protein
LNWITPQLAIGDIHDARHVAGSLESLVEAVLQIYHPDPDPKAFSGALAELHLCAEDGRPLPRGLLRRGVRFVRQQVGNGHRVLVHCGAGRSRSAVFAAAYLAQEGLSSLEALAAVIEARPVVLPHPVLMDAFLEFCGDPTPRPEFAAEAVRLRARILAKQRG